MQTLEAEAVQYNSSLQGAKAGKDLNQNISLRAGKISNRAQVNPTSNEQAKVQKTV